MLRELTDLTIRKAIREAVAAGKPMKRFDQRHLYLYLTPQGSALWRFRYTFQGKEKLLSLGKYPLVTLKQARDKYHKHLALVRDPDKPIDPGAVRKAAKRAAKHAQANTVEMLAAEWLAKQESEVTAGTLRRHRQRLDKYIFSTLGKEPIATVTAQELLAALRRIEATGKKDTAIRTRELCSAIWRYAVVEGRAPHDIAGDLRGVLAPAASKNYGALTDPKAIGGLLRAIDGYQGSSVVVHALKLAPLVFVRPGELRKATWDEFDLDGDKPEWRIRAERMKMKRQHIVPLAPQAVAILKATKEHTGKGKYVFPNPRTHSRPMSENAVNAALRGMGYTKEQMTGHGFRSVASTLLNELGWHPDLIELQLAHEERNKVRAAYNKAQRLEERRKMMVAWADHLDTLRAGDNKVVAINRKAAS